MDKFGSDLTMILHVASSGGGWREEAGSEKKDVFLVADVGENEDSLGQTVVL